MLEISHLLSKVIAVTMSHGWSNKKNHVSQNMYVLPQYANGNHHLVLQNGLVNLRLRAHFKLKFGLVRRLVV